jgi:GT2 family glycosyltransferase
MEILTVVVLYKMPLSDSQALRSLASGLNSDPGLKDCVEVLLWDNSPERLNECEIGFPCRYEHATRNAGVSGAYNGALKIAANLGCPWLLLLDQDTILPLDFLRRMLEYVRLVRSRPEIAAVLPTVWVNSRYMFPRRVCFNGTRAYQETFTGKTREETTTANSGVLMRVSALQEIGGYSEEFNFEFSDLYVFHQLHRAGKRMWVAQDIRLDHKIAITDYGGEFTPERYRRFLVVEDAFVTLYKGTAENAAQALRLLARFSKQLIRYPDKRYARISLEYFVKKLLVSRTVRLKAWRKNILGQERTDEVPDQWMT